MENQVSVVGVAREAQQSVGSRISWGAVLGGTATALGVYYLLGILTAAVGMSAAAAGVFVGMRPNLRFVPIIVARRTTATV